MIYSYLLSDDKLKTPITLLYSQKWGSQNQDYRDHLRKDLYQWLQNQNYQPTESVLDLKQRPQTKELCISISHNEDWGIIALSSISIGIDIETMSRVSERTLKRVLKKEETPHPNPTRHWCAKEATFKCLHNSSKVTNKPVTLGQIEIFWSNEHLYRAYFEKHTIEGVIYSEIKNLNNNVISMSTLP